ncbi:MULTISPECIES: molybdopterin-binding protein [unclassified Halorubrum]|uniref:competence/damage-inducible protein A n=1 Tax=unclassified Halorubrum TaxID=2642239 RepID=UPI000B9934CA|nr:MULTISPECIES: molybdopterin-binding protein [unclassified Halorubrum]OYR45402.1 competence/damage-inducible protein A [Halorubrum sp. Hd13]OYR46188.1 competence/damage-inducible protein A [Halorubrum sp. Eb13]OYR49834.1 competence/damage-inducible protein A [Halorubrum sp. Ea8]OYR54605.1 competence/damage-inducible protein A [Halorubrum sp. Ea1]
MNAAVVTVGDELLVGDTENTNATWLCDRLDERGVVVRRVTVVPDEVGEIARVVNEYHAEYDAVIVTGGLGPTHDDVTMDGVAAAFGRGLERNDEAASWLAERGYSADDLAAETTHLPADCRPLANETGVAPGAVVESVYVLPGVPTEMKAMFESVADEFEGTPTHTVTVDVDEPESALLERFTELQEEFDVSVGSYPGESVRVKITATDAAEAERAAEWVRERSTLVETR